MTECAGWLANWHGPLGDELAIAPSVLGIALRWWEGQFYCEVVDDHDGLRVRIFRAGALVWQQPVESASVAFQVVRELTYTFRRGNARGG